jgi:hypothetical protein
MSAADALSTADVAAGRGECDAKFVQCHRDLLHGPKPLPAKPSSVLTASSSGSTVPKWASPMINLMGAGSWACSASSAGTFGESGQPGSAHPGRPGHRKVGHLSRDLAMANSVPPSTGSCLAWSC